MKKRTDKPYRASAEDALFRASVADVKPLPARNDAALEKPKPRPRPREREMDDAVADTLSDSIAFTREAGEPLSFTRPGLQRQAVRRLRRGGSRVEDELDLHGLTVAQARPLLVGFLEHCARTGARHVRIIHGKGLRSESGEGVLKGMVASWLTQRADVLAFHEARAGDGGSGAVLVFLRGMRDEG
jgi:DNA-nicking Smr family endonuclease